MTRCGQGERWGHPLAPNRGVSEAILSAIETRKDIFIELAAWLAREHALRVAPSTVHRFLVRHRITLKSRRMPAGRSARTCAARQAWVDG